MAMRPEVMPITYRHRMKMSTSLPIMAGAATVAGAT